MLTLEPKDLSTPQLHSYLLGAIGPRPIAFASTIDENGTPNLAPFSFFNIFSANPPILIFSPARNGHTGESKDTYKNIKKVAECVINIVNYDMVAQMSLCSSYGIDINEFEKSGLTPVPSEKVKPFRVKESPVQMECKVIEVKKLGDDGGNLIICEVVKIHINKAILDESQLIDQQKIDLVSRMGGNWYCRANEASMFEVKKPVTTIGIGYDNIPEDIRTSTILSGNDLGKLGSSEELPNETDVNEYKLIELSELFVTLEDEPAKLELELHKLAKKYLDKNEVEAAWMTLLAFNNQ